MSTPSRASIPQLCKTAWRDDAPQEYDWLCRTSGTVAGRPGTIPASCGPFTAPAPAGACWRHPHAIPPAGREKITSAGEIQISRVLFTMDYQLFISYRREEITGGIAFREPAEYKLPFPFLTFRYARPVFPGHPPDCQSRRIHGPASTGLPRKIRARTPVLQSAPVSPRGSPADQPSGHGTTAIRGMSTSPARQQSFSARYVSGEDNRSSCGRCRPWDARTPFWIEPDPFHVCFCLL